jgi:hypothetical protein
LRPNLLVKEILVDYLIFISFTRHRCGCKKGGALLYQCPPQSQVCDPTKTFKIMKKLLLLSCLALLPVMQCLVAQAEFECGMDGSGGTSSPLTTIPPCVEQGPCENTADDLYVPVQGNPGNNNDFLLLVSESGLKPRTLVRTIHFVRFS